MFLLPLMLLRNYLYTLDTQLGINLHRLKFSDLNKGNLTMIDVVNPHIL